MSCSFCIFRVLCPHVSWFVSPCVVGPIAVTQYAITPGKMRVPKRAALSLDVQYLQNSIFHERFIILASNAPAAGSGHLLRMVC